MVDGVIDGVKGEMTFRVKGWYDVGSKREG